MVHKTIHSKLQLGQLESPQNVVGPGNSKRAISGIHHGVCVVQGMKQIELYSWYVLVQFLGYRCDKYRQ
jgi:hypothetical protein